MLAVQHVMHADCTIYVYVPDYSTHIYCVCYFIRIYSSSSISSALFFVWWVVVLVFVSLGQQGRHTAVYTTHVRPGWIDGLGSEYLDILKHPCVAPTGDPNAWAC